MQSDDGEAPRSDGRGEQDSESSPVTLARRLVYFAAERTLLTWVRAALGLMTLGFVIDRFGLVVQQVLPGKGNGLQSRAFSFWTGATLVALGALMAAMGAVRYLLFSRNYYRDGSTRPGTGVIQGVYFAVAIAIVAVTISVYLAMVYP